MDLFSADKIRVLRSIRALFRDPQNNLRVFINGHLVADDYDDPSSSRIAKLLRLNDENSSIDLFLANILCGNPILQRLRDYQRRLDRFDIEFVHAIYDKLTAEERQSIDQRHLSIPSETLKNMLIDGGGENYSSSDIPAADDKFNMFAEFLASVTLKDLSLLITLTTVDYDNNNIHHEIHPVDLDPKPFNRIPHYFDLDQRIISHYTNLVSSGLITHNPCI
jgi:inositol-pentakisphosphate 2-kinase